MKIFILVAVLIATAPANTQEQSFTIGAINLYGYAGVDVSRLKATLPLREGNQVLTGTKEKIVADITLAIKRAIGREVVDVAPVCCDERGRLLIYIGLRDESVRHTTYNIQPRGSARLSATAIRVYRDAEQALSNAIYRGASGEDDSQGYALSVDPDARVRQLALHHYAARNSTSVRHVLASARDVKQRQIAAEILGYAGRSREQIRALIRASHDVDSGVRNNAIRALVVLARSSPSVSALIPGECFIDLLNSGIWSDRNKSVALLAVLTKGRDARLLACLREQAFTSLIEMARWSYAGHADSARLILGRVAGIEEKTLTAMVARQEIEPIIEVVTTQKKIAGNARHNCPLCAALHKKSAFSFGDSLLRRSKMFIARGNLRLFRSVGAACNCSPKSRLRTSGARRLIKTARL
jgi:hypothetical protein